jgi:hypothetical protein
MSRSDDVVPLLPEVSYPAGYAFITPDRKCRFMTIDLGIPEGDRVSIADGLSRLLA